jgi:hypothetical protein
MTILTVLTVQHNFQSCHQETQGYLPSLQCKTYPRATTHFFGIESYSLSFLSKWISSSPQCEWDSGWIHGPCPYIHRQVIARGRSCIVNLASILVFLDGMIGSCSPLISTSTNPFPMTSLMVSPSISICADKLLSTIIAIKTILSGSIRSADDRRCNLLGKMLHFIDNLK